MLTFNTKRFAEILTEQRLIPADIARLLNVSRTAVYHWMRGHVCPSRKNLKRLAQVLGIPVTDLLYFDEDSDSSNPST